MGTATLCLPTNLVVVRFLIPMGRYAWHFDAALTITREALFTKAEKSDIAVNNTINHREPGQAHESDK